MRGREVGRRPAAAVWRLSAVAIGLFLAGCVSLPANKGSTQEAPPRAGDKGVTRGPVGPGEVRIAIEPAARAEEPPRSARPRPVTSRPMAKLQALFSMGTVSGEDLLLELRAIRTAMAEQRTANATTALLGSLQLAAKSGAPGRTGTGGTTKAGPNRTAKGQPAPAKGSGKASDVLTAAGLALLDALLDQYVATVAQAALDRHLASLIGQTGALAEERIALPSPQGLSEGALQRTATMAALVVGMRLTNRVLGQAQKDFEGVEGEYSALLRQREASAGLLYELLMQRSAGDAQARQALERSLPAKDLAYLDARVTGLSLREFSADMGAQNLALAYLRQTDPRAAQGYEAASADAVKRTQAYVRTVSGVAAFGGLLAAYAREISKLSRSHDAQQVVAALPFVVEFIKEVPPLVKVAASVGANGVVVDVGAGMFPKRFRVADAAGSEDVSDAAAVYKQLKTRQADALLGSALFQDSSTGLLNRVWQCDARAAGFMLDQAVPDAQRSEFAQRYLAQDGADFLFADFFERPHRTGKARELPLQLLGRDHRRNTSDATRSVAALQSQVAEGYGKWGDEQLMRLIFANREGSAAHATLQLGEVTVRPIPSAQSLYVYESLADRCRSALGTGAVQASR